jgi:hypothetical protein
VTHRWTRRDLAAALGPGLLAACAPTRPLVSVNLLDTPAPAPTPQAPEPDAGAQLESAFDEARRMTVPVRLNNAGPFQFVVDTGANRSVVAREVAGVCGLPSAGQAPVHGIAGVQPADLVAVRRFSVGSVVSARLQLPMLPHAQLGADGLMGVDVLKNRRVVLDFIANRFEVAASGSGIEIGRERATRIPDRGDSVQVPAQNRFGQLVIVDAEVGGVRVNAFIDSGSQVTVGNRALRDAVIHERPEFGPRLAPVPLISATGQTARGEFAPLPTVRLGGLAVNQILGIFADLHVFELWKLDDRPSILIGIDVLRHFADVTLDFGRRQVVFRPLRPGRRPRR